MRLETLSARLGYPLLPDPDVSLVEVAADEGPSPQVSAHCVGE